MKHFFLKYLMIFVCSFIFCLSHVYSSTDFEKEFNRLSNEIAEKIAGNEKKKIAVVDFTDLNGSVTELGRFSAEELSAALAVVGKKFEVVDRIHLKTILKEHKLSSTGLIDQKTVHKLGKLAGVDALVTGTLTPMGESVRITIKVLDIETATVIDAKRGNIAMTDAIKSLLESEIHTTGKQIIDSTNKGLKVKAARGVEALGYVFQAVDCKVSGNKVICSVLITNKEDDRDLTVYFSDTGLNDDFGNQYPVKKIQIGGTISTGRVWGTFRKNLFSGVPTKAYLTFEKISPQAKMASALILYCWSRNSDGKYKYFSATMRNIPFSK